MTHEEKQIHNAVHAELREFEEFKKLVKRMREAQNRVDMLAGGEDIEFVDMLCIEQREAEREVDEYLRYDTRRKTTRN
jgi:hypothetical protein